MLGDVVNLNKKLKTFTGFDNAFITTVVPHDKKTGVF